CCVPNPSFCMREKCKICARTPVEAAQQLAQTGNSTHLAPCTPGWTTRVRRSSVRLSRDEYRTQRRRMPLNGQQRVGGVERFRQGLEAHPRRGALLLDRGPVQVDQADVGVT